MIKDKFERFFLKKFSEESFLIQKKAQALFYFAMTVAIVMILLIFAFVFFNPDILFQAGIVIVFIFFISIITLFILKTGKYYFAANLL